MWLVFLTVEAISLVSCDKTIPYYDKVEEVNHSDSVYSPINNKYEGNDSTNKIVTFSVLGNSISTYKGYIPSSYKCYSRYMPGKFKVEDTWWMLLKMISGYELLSNASWSGSTIVNEGASDSNSYFTSDKRLTELGRKGTPDIILVLGGTNDWGNSKELGDFPSDSSFDMKTFRGAYSYLVKKLCDMYPNSKICCCSILPRKGFDSPNKKGWYTTDGNKSIETITYKYGCIYLDNVLSARGRSITTPHFSPTARFFLHNSRKSPLFAQEKRLHCQRIANPLGRR